MKKKDKRLINKEKKLFTLYQAALKSFAKYGYKKTTVEDIAGELGMTKGNIYLYVKNKRDLYEKTIIYAVSNFLDTMQASIREEDHVLTQITRLAEAGVAYLSENKDARNLFADVPNIITDPATYGERFGEIIEKSIKMIRGVLEKGVQEKFLRDFDVDYVAELLFYFYGLFIMNTVVLTNVLSKRKSTAKMYVEIVNLVLFGIVRKGDDKIPDYPKFDNGFLSAP